MARFARGIISGEYSLGLVRNHISLTTYIQFLEEMRKVIEKNLLSSGDEKPTKNKKKDTTTEEIKNCIENTIFSSDDEKPIKNKKKVLTKKTKKVVKKSDSTSSSGDDKVHKKPKKN